MNTELRAQLTQAVADDYLEPLALALADWGLRHGASPPVALSLALLVNAVQEGHSCLCIQTPPQLPGTNQAAFTDADSWRRALQASPLVGPPGARCPLILDGDLLYLQRYYDYEQRLAQQLGDMLQAPPQSLDVQTLLPAAGIFTRDQLAPDACDWQAVAALVALRHRFALISGGPGTGKTYTVLRLMYLLLLQARQQGAAAPLIKLAAPTGKAATRMMESVQAGLAAMQLPADLAAQMPQQAQTLHRLLGMSGRSSKPKFDREQPLPLDVLILDEASMVDLPMMTKLLEALPTQARLVLLGDRYQLASVESGAVLAELCALAGVNNFSAEQREAAAALLPATLQATSPTAEAPPLSKLSDHVVTLQTSRRFSADSVIGRAAQAVNDGDLDALLALITSDGELTQQTVTSPEQLQLLVQEAVAAYGVLLAPGISPAEALAQAAHYRVLCATRVGSYGSHNLNQLINAALLQQFGLPADKRWYHGRLVLITENDYRAGLFNGDLGIALHDAQTDSEDASALRIWFATEQGLRAYLPSSIPSHDSAWAMTIHKSQGSEFTRLSLVLPPSDLPLLTRELVYTGLTRARDGVCLWGEKAVLKAALGRRTRRLSGLRGRLAGGPESE